jgi:L-alanine-DL-glutamate epimerase-like enolase superfamily enzyme
VVGRSSHTLAHISRRSLLKGLGSAAALLLAGDTAPARPLFLVLANEPSQISSIEWIVYRTGRQRSDGQPEQRCAIRITCAGGAQGWADLASSVTADRDNARFIRDIAVGRSTTEHNAIWRQLHESGLSPAVLAGVDLALWDLVGRIEGKPAHALLGGRRESVEACASTGFNLANPQEYADFAVACKEKGLRACKVQPYVEWSTGPNGLPTTGFPDRDVAVYRAVREAVGPDYPLMADNACAYTFDQALRVGHLLDELGYKQWRSPMPESDDWLDRYTSLVTQIRTPVCAPRTNPDSHPARILWIAARACDIACMDVLHGGLTACLELASACEEAGIPLALPDIGPDSYPHLQLTAAGSETLIEYYEVSSPTRDPRTLPGRLTPEPTFDDQGRIPIPQAPGLGLDLDWKYIFTHRAA